MYASASPDPIAQALLGAALLMLGVLGSVPLALVHLVGAFGTLTAPGTGRLRTLWLVCAACIVLGAAVMAEHVDKLVAPFLLPAALLPLANGASAWRVSNKLRDGDALGPLDRWSLRLAPVAWLGLFAYFVLEVFPKT